jgi:hypothetical protein
MEGSTMESEAGDGLEAGSTVDLRDRSLLALLEIGAAAVLIGSFSVPWYVTSGPGYTTWISAGGYSPSGLLTQELIPFASLVAVVVALAGLALPARGAKIAILVAFAAAFYGAILQFQEVQSGESAYLVPPTAAWGLWLFAGAAFAGVALAVVDLVRGGSSTFLWRAIRRPSIRRYGLPAAYVVMLVVTLPAALFPMDPHWWLFLWLAAVLALPLWVVRARRAR